MKKVLNAIKRKSKYYCLESERIGSCYHEFQKGRLAELAVWQEDSILIKDKEFLRLNLKDLFLKAVPHYDYYGNTLMDKYYWEKVCDEARKVGGETWLAVKEADIWARRVFELEDVFTIVGM